MDESEEVMNLVSKVGRLPREDQTRILRMVDLLSLASARVQRRTQHMLSALLAEQPHSKNECVASVDEVIEYLEQAVYGDESCAPDWARFDEPTIVGNA